MKSNQTTPAEQRLAYLESLVSALGGVVWEFDWSTGAFTYVSGAAEKLLGYSLGEWMEPGFWANHLHPDDAQTAVDYCVAATKAGEDHEFEYRMIHKDGGVVWVRDIVTVDPELRLEGRLKGIIIDITQHRRASEQFERKSAEFDAVFRVMQDLYFRMDASNVVVDFKAPARDMLYRDREEILGARITDLMPRSMHEMLVSNLDLARESDTMVVTRYQLYTGGVLRHWEARFLPVGGGDVVVISRDVSDRHEANMRLALSQERYRTLVEMSPYSIYVVGLDQRVMFCNAAAEQMFGGHPGDTIVGACVGDLVPEEHLDSPSMKDLLRVAHEMSEIKPGDPMPLSKAQRCHAVRLDGSPISIERTVSGIRYRGEPALLVLARDITEEIEVENALLESEVRLRDAQLMARVGHYAIDIPTDHWTSSEALDKVLGITPEFTRDSAGWAALLHPDDRDEMVAYFDEIVTGLHGFDRDYRIVRPSDGETRWVHGIGQLTLGDDGVPVEMFGTIQDITERKLAEEVERRYSERLSAMASELTVTEERERRRLAEELHDRVSQQLAMAKLHLGSAAADPSRPDVAEIASAAALIEEAIGQTRAITTQLAPPVLYELGVGSALRWQCEDVASTMGLAVRFSGRADESGISDEARVVVFRAVRELLVNVVKHAGTSQAWVSVDNLPGWLEVTVVDEGCGFDPASPNSGSKDSGFGLFSIRERLPHLGGEFEFESAPGKGTRVTLRVPRQEA